MYLETERTVLRPFVEKDAEDVFDYSKNPNVGNAAGWKPHKDLDETKDVMRTVFLGQKTICAIEYNGKVIGSVGFLGDNRRNNPKCLMLGYAMGEDYWGKGLMTECCKAVIGYAFRNLDIDILTSNCYDDNLRSKRVIEKCGFEYEGTLHGAEVTSDGKVKDILSFYLTKKQWTENASNGGKNV